MTEAFVEDIKKIQERVADVLSEQNSIASDFFNMSLKTTTELGNY